MKNFVQEGEILLYPNASGSTILGGSVVVAGDLAGVAIANILDGDAGSVMLEGVFALPKVAGAVTLGAKVYLIVADGTVTTTSTSNTLIGRCFKAALSADATVDVVLTNMI